ncbi:MAG: L-serine ammonia-lyase, iron-sulfur-dependent subunit beta [Candidatus Woesearchaeota archaeon]
MSSIFDIMGPVMVGPSSSHTAGAVKLGRIAGFIFSDEIKKAEILFHGSFANTYKGHGTDRAIIAGILGFKPDDERIKESIDIAREKGIEVFFKEKEMREVHPNTAKIILSNDENSISMLGSSIGGSDIKIIEIDEFEVDISGKLPTLWVIHHDRPGMVGTVTSILGSYSLNIANMQNFRRKKGKTASSIIELDHAVDEYILTHLNNVDGIELVRYIPPVWS